MIERERVFVRRERERERERENERGGIICQSKNLIK